jgi:hypothetical protein
LLRNSAILPALLASSVLILLAACGSGAGGGTDATPGPTSEPPTPADSGAIRNVDLTQTVALQSFMRQVGGGEPDLAAVKYADLTKDGREEAVVPISSGGTLGNLGYIVLTMKGGAPASLLTATRDRNSIGGVMMNIEDGKLVKYIGRYGPEDPRCCPSMLVKTTYYWDGSALQVEREDEVKAGTQKQ